MYGDYAVHDDYAVPLPTTSYPVSPGDSMSASVSVTGVGNWTLTIADATKGWSYSTNITWATPTRVSAEWIVERPDVSGETDTSLADFGTASFTSATASVGSTSGPASQWGDQVLDMVEGTDLLAAAYSLDATGEDFTDLWQASS
jgi:hypothetical protein